MNLDKICEIKKVVSVLKEQIKCSICLNRIKNCSQLQCGHEFCKGCIDKYWSITESYLCPLCKKTFKKRQKPHKNWFVDELGCFVSNISQILASQEQDKSSASKNQYFAANSIINKTDDKENAFNLLLSNTRNQKRRCYTNKRKTNNMDQSLLHFQDAGTRHNIINWLNDANEKLDVFSQKSQTLQQLEDYKNQQLEFPRVRSQSLSIIKKTFKEPLLKRYQSLSNCMDTDNYTIEDVNSEQFVQQAERKVIQDMLEDECLDSLDNFMQQNDAHLLIEPEKPSKKYGDKKTPPSASANSGWERVKNVKRSIKKASKVPKKLNISLQSEEKIERKYKRKRNVIEENNVETKKLKEIEVKLPIHNKENTTIDQAVEILEPQVSSISKQNKNFNPSSVEKYFVQNIQNISPYLDSPLRVSKRKSKKEIFQNLDTETQMMDFVQAKTQREGSMNQITEQREFQKPLDQAMDGIEITPNLKTLSPKKSAINILLNGAKTQNTNNSDETSLEESQKKLKTDEIFHSKFDFVPNVCNKENSIDNVLEQLNDNLEKCVERALEIKDPIPNSLIDCFLNLKSFVNKGQEIRNGKEHRAIQVRAQTCNVEVQTSTLQLSEKNLQTSQIICTKKIAEFVNEQVQTSYCLNTEGGMQNNKNVGGEESQIISSNNFNNQKSSFKIKILDTSTPINNGNKSAIDLISKITHLDTPVLNNIIEEMNFNDKDYQNTRKDKTQESVLILTAPKTPNKISRKLTFGDSNPTQKKFKRIKKRPVDDSDDEDDPKKGSKQFMRDDLTIKFVDTQTEQMEVESEKTPENFDYDQYLDEVMQKYGNSSKNKAIEVVSRKKEDTKKISFVRTSQTAGSSRVAHNVSHTKESIQTEQTIDTKNKNKILTKTESNDFEDHVFTADVAFQENLENFDRAIAECEKNDKNTESNDIVENTPTDELVPLKIKLASLNKNKNSSKRNDPTKNIRKNKPRNKEELKESIADEVQDMLEDIRNDASFFNTVMESQMPVKYQSAIEGSQNKFKEPQNEEVINMHSETFCDIEPIKNKSDLKDRIIDYKNIAPKVPTFEEDDVFKDDLLEAELEKISFTAEQNKIRSGINILQNIKVKSQVRGNEDAKNIEVEIEDSGEEDFVEKTPEKKSRFVDRSLIAKLQQADSPAPLEFNDDHFGDIDLCLPPPPGFGDDVDTTDLSDKAVITKVLKPTQVGLTEMIVTPETCMSSPKNDHIQNEKANPLNISLGLTNTPKVKNTSNHSTPRSQFKEIESLGFSPIKINTQSQGKAPLTSTPLVTKLSTKKATGLLTSAPNQKSILNYVTPTQVSSQKFKPCLTYSRLMDKDMSVFTQLELRKLVTVSNSWVPNVTHLVVLADDKGRLISHTAKYLMALAHSAWVVRYEWVQDCVKQNKIVPEEPYEVLDLSGTTGPKTSRLIREKNPLFKDYRFLCFSPFQLIPKSDLEIVLRQFGGEVVADIRDLRKNNKIGLVITDTTASEELCKFEELLEKYRVVTVDVEWATKCIGQYNICSVRPYLLCSDENIHDLGYPKELVETVPYTLTEGTFGQ